MCGDMKRYNALVKKFPIVCLCGSTRFESLFHKLAEKLTFEGNIVLTVNCWSNKAILHAPKTQSLKLVKDMLDRLHKAKIEMADRVFVINKDGYIGASTRSEIEYAKKLGKPIDYWTPYSRIPEHDKPENRQMAAKLREKYPAHYWVCDPVLCYCINCGLPLGLEKEGDLATCPKGDI